MDKKMQELDSPLDYVKFALIDDDIIEATVHKKIEITLQKVKEIEAFYLHTFPEGKYGVLVNRKNKYSHSSESLVRIPKMYRQHALAILTYSELASKVAKLHQITPGETIIEIFSDREEAIAWLKKTLNEG